jgi:hypothetical protein
MRTDRNNNPAAFTVDVAKQAGLVEGVDYVPGDPFEVGMEGRQQTYYTAHLLGDPVALTIRVIDAIGYFTANHVPRWSYIALPKALWDGLTPGQKVWVVGYHYQQEGGLTMKSLFPAQYPSEPSHPIDPPKA